MPSRLPCNHDVLASFDVKTCPKPKDCMCLQVWMAGQTKSNSPLVSNPQKAYVQTTILRSDHSIRNHPGRNHGTIPIRLFPGDDEPRPVRLFPLARIHAAARQ